MDNISIIKNNIVIYIKKNIINYQLLGGSFNLNDLLSTTNGKEVISYFFDGLLNPVNN